MARRQVDAEINADPVIITPHRRSKIDDGAGGFTLSPPIPQVPVEVLIAPAKRRLSDMITSTELGDVVDYSYILLARAGSDIKRGDTFQWQGDDYKVVSLHIKTEVSVTAQVDYFGGNLNG